MEPTVADLAADSGALLNVMGVAMPAGRYRMLELQFASGVLVLHCDDDTDELIAEVGRPPTGAPVIADSWAGGLLGKQIEYAWDLRNHRGYSDGFQLRLVDGRGGEEARQFEVAGSGIDVRWVIPTGASA